MNVVDIVVIVVLVLAFFVGFKKGAVSSIVSLVGTFLVFVVAWFLKNPLSTIFYENLPFQNFGGIFKGITSFNILFYEALSYLIILLILFTVLKVILKLTGLVDKLINMTVILALPNKLIGGVCSLLEYSIIAFIVLFIMVQVPSTSKFVNESVVGPFLLSKTPVLSSITKDATNAVLDVYDICVLSKEDKDASVNYDYDALDTLMKHEVISVDSVKKLQEKGKLKIENLDELIVKYESTEGES